MLDFILQFGKYFNLKIKKVIVRLDGIGIDSEEIDIEKIRLKLINIINKGSFIVYQSEFSKSCFNNIYDSLPPGKKLYIMVSKTFQITI